MKRETAQVVCTLPILLLALGFAPHRGLGQEVVLNPDLTDVASGSGWSLFNRDAETKAIGASPAAYLSARDGFGMAWLDGVSLAEGTIEVTLQGRNVPQASFIGVAFRGMDNETFEAVYFRPFNFQAANPVARSHAVQYVSHPAHTWQRLRSDSPGAFEAELSPAPPPDAPFRARIELVGDVVRVFVNDAATPCLEIRAMGSGMAGRVGLWVGNNSDGLFSDLQIGMR